MCGLSGAVGVIDDTVRSAVEAGDACLHHRGPDDRGAWSSELDASGRGVTLAHRRLAIIDLRPESAQPMVDAGRGTVLVFNGEIYNYRELRRELEALGETFRTAGDSEVLLKALGRWGEGALSRLRGMFAFAFWDPRARTVLLARDRLGIKPLYWCRVERPGGGSAVLFASELRALLAGGLVERRLDPAGVTTYLWNGFVPGPGTIIRGISLLPAGGAATVRVDDPLVEPEPWWRLPAHRHGGSDRDELEAALREAVAMRLISDVPLGIFLSGGIDSSAVAALAAADASSPVRTFTIAFEEAEYDEAAHARAVASAIGSDHMEVPLGAAAFRDGLPDALESLDQPTFDAINTWFVSRAVREAGLTVALAGTGGDELFGGYRSFTDVPRLARVARMLRALPPGTRRRLGAVAARLKVGAYGAVPPQTRWGKLPDALCSGDDLLAAYQTSYALYTRDFLAELQDEAAAAGDGAVHLGLPASWADELAALVEDQPPRHAVSLLECACFLGQRLLRDTDAASMAVSLEVRVPLLDHVVVEAVAGQPLADRFEPPGRKQMLRDLALRGLDPALFERPKRGFVLPLDRWCRRELSGQVEQTLHDEQACAAAGLRPAAVARLWHAFREGAPGIYWSRVWALHTLLWWCRRHDATI